MEDLPFAKRTPRNRPVPPPEPRGPFSDYSTAVPLSDPSFQHNLRQIGITQQLLFKSMQHRVSHDI